jgi:hypothetical protein
MRPPTGAGPAVGSGAGRHLTGRYATMPCGSMTYFLAAPLSKRW